MITPAQLANALFPHEVQHLRVRETHLSFVVLTGRVAYKIKKAVRLDFVDTTSLDTRREFCEEELRLNRRYAPDLYLRVVSVVVDGRALRFDGPGDPVEFAVQMRQFDPKDELRALLERDLVTTAEICELADRVAMFHHTAAVLDRSNLPGTQSLVRKSRQNVAGVAARASRIRAEPIAVELQQWTEGTLARVADPLAQRERNGFVRECHGDMHVGNVVRWNGALLPFDCIEFDPELRFIDVLNDVAFLMMDLIANDRSDLAFALLNRYLERTGDYAGTTLLPCYLVYRALVRTKVELMGSEESNKPDECRRRAESYLRTARLLAAPAKGPVLIVMHGASGSGKSWLSGQLVPALAALRVRSDLERKRLGGIDPFDTTPAARDDIYTLDFNHRTYAHLLECARACLEGGINVVIDAAFLKRQERREFAALARERATPFLVVSCRADARTLAQRIAARRAARADPSDADEEVMRRQLQTMESLGSDELPEAIEIDTRDAESLERVLKRAERIFIAR